MEFTAQLCTFEIDSSVSQRAFKIHEITPIRFDDIDDIVILNNYLIIDTLENDIKVIDKNGYKLLYCIAINSGGLFKVDENSCSFEDCDAKKYYILRIFNFDSFKLNKQLDSKIIGENNSDKFVLQSISKIRFDNYKKQCEILEFKLPTFILENLKIRLQNR